MKWCCMVLVLYAVSRYKLQRMAKIIGEISLLVTNKVQTFHWVGYGLKLNIPQQALPAGLKQCELIKVGISGQFTLPQNTSLHTCMPD